MSKSSGPPDLPFDQCCNCFKIAEELWKDSGQRLLLCSRCRRTRYCNAQCQKNAWAAHKRYCTASQEVMEELEGRAKALKEVGKVLGVKLSSELNPALFMEHFRKWTQVHRPAFGEAIIQALQLVRFPERCLTHAVILKAERVEGPQKQTAATRFSLMSAEVTTMQGALDFYAPPDAPSQMRKWLTEHIAAIKARYADPKSEFILPLALLAAGQMCQIMQTGPLRDPAKARDEDLD